MLTPNLTHRLRSWLILLTVAWMGAVVGPSRTEAQFYFGKNKVQYSSFDWQVMQTEHFDIYFYTEESDLVGTAAHMAESAYVELAERFCHEIPKRVPLIVYSSPSYFTQTNILPYLIPESVAGFTEFMKGRVVVPFNGSHYDFAHVIRHELVHAFMISRLDEAFRRQRRSRLGYPPLWFTEGLAEYWSNRWSTREDMTVGDMVINNRIDGLNTLWQLSGSFYMYKLGESLLHYIDSTYGPDKITLLFENWHKSNTFEGVVEITLGEKLDKVVEGWLYYLKRRYYPELSDRGLPQGESERITQELFAEKGVPIHWDDGDGLREWVVYKAYRFGYSGIYMKPVEESDSRRRTLLKAERSADFESLHLMRSSIDANDSGMVVFSSKSRERDVLYLYSLRKKEVVRRYEFADLTEVRSPRLSHRGDRVVFSGVGKSGYTDIFVLEIETGAYRALTSDLYLDADPAFSVDDREIMFSSDRCHHGLEGAQNLYAIGIANGQVRQLTFGPYRDQHPECTEKGVYFSSNRSGLFNLYRLESNGTLLEQSRFATAALDPRVSSDGRKMMYTGYQDMGYHIYQMDLPPDPAVVQQAPDGEPWWRPPLLPRRHRQSAVKYQTEYSFDIAQSAMSYDPVFGSMGGIQIAISDMLGDHSVHFLLTNSAQTKDELLESFNVGVTYVNREKRLHKGGGVFHLYDEYYNEYDKYYFERQAGVVGFLSYPISKYSRFDFTGVARYSNRDSRFSQNDREAFLVSNYLSWVYDNSIWDISGPIDGRRYHLTVGHTTSLNDMESFSRTAIADIRHYFRLGSASAVANRLMAFTSAGREPQRVYLGGSWSFRGYDRRAFYDRNVLFASTELRFPLIDKLTIGLPFGNLDFRGIRGALFYDTGTAWDESFDRFLGSYGTGFRVAIGGVILLRFDFARTHDYRTTNPHTDFDFFFGWNF